MTIHVAFRELLPKPWITILAIVIPATAPSGDVDPSLAAKYMEEAKEVCAKDGGSLWGRSLEGPLLFASRETRRIAANRADLEGYLSAEGRIFVGQLPEEVSIANTATDWAGVRWTMVAWPLPEDPTARRRLVAHELFHRIQDELGLPARNPANVHLDTKDGRIWLRLEWRALAAALRASDRKERISHIEDALLFRRHRHSLFPPAGDQERELELNEGLAEYTGLRLCGGDPEDLLESLANTLDHLPSSSTTLMRSFAYTSGPAYGCLLDALASDWREEIDASDDLAELLAKAAGVELPKIAVEQLIDRGTAYGRDTIVAEENEREEARLRRLDGYRALLVDGPIVILPMTGDVQYSFNPRNLEALDDLGTVYPTLRISDAWGILEVVSGPALMLASRKAVHVAAPLERGEGSARGEGWTLTLHEGWKLVAGERKGDWRLQRKEEAR